MKKYFLILFVVLFFFSHNAFATQIAGSFSGTVIAGTDYGGTIIGVNGNLEGLSISGEFSYNTNNAPELDPSSEPGVREWYYSPTGGWIDLDIIINGVSVNFSDYPMHGIQIYDEYDGFDLFGLYIGDPDNFFEIRIQEYIDDIISTASLTTEIDWSIELATGPGEHGGNFSLTDIGINAVFEIDSLNIAPINDSDTDGDSTPDSKVNILPVLSLLLDDTSYDPNAPRSLAIDSSYDLILNDGIDNTIITVDLIPYDKKKGIIEDGTIIEFDVISGSAILSSSSASTINGQANVTLTSLTEGSVSVSVKVKDTFVAGIVDINVVSDFSDVFSKAPNSSTVVINGYYQAGSLFSLSITNNSSTRTFNLTRAELKNGSSIVSYTTDTSLLSNGQLSPGESIYLQATLNSPLLDQGMQFIYYLNDPISGNSFTVSASYVMWW